MEKRMNTGQRNDDIRRKEQCGCLTMEETKGGALAFCLMCSPPAKTSGWHVTKFIDGADQDKTTIPTLKRGGMNGGIAILQDDGTYLLKPPMQMREESLDPKADPMTFVLAHRVAVHQCEGWPYPRVVIHRARYYSGDEDGTYAIGGCARVLDGIDGVEIALALSGYDIAPA
jgi:hypothetical protein